MCVCVWGGGVCVVSWTMIVFNYNNMYITTIVIHMSK